MQYQSSVLCIINLIQHEHVAARFHQACQRLELAMHCMMRTVTIAFLARAVQGSFQHYHGVTWTMVEEQLCVRMSVILCVCLCVHD